MALFRHFILLALLSYSAMSQAQTVIEIYVDTGVSGGAADGSSLANAYSGIQTAVDTECGASPNRLTSDDLVTNNEIAKFLLNATTGVADGQLFSATLCTTSTTNYLWFVGEGFGTNGEYDTSKYRIEYTSTSNGFRAFYDNHTGTRVEDLQVKVTTSTFTGVDGIEFAGTDQDLWRARIQVVGSASATANGYEGNSCGAEVRDVLVVYESTGSTTAGADNSAFFGCSDLYNTGAVGAPVGYWPESFGGPKARNTYTMDHVTDGYDATNTWTTADNNASDTGDAPGTSAQNGQVTWENAAGGDYRPSDSDTIAKLNGVDLSGIFTTDMIGGTWPATWSIGPLIPAPAAGGVTHIRTMNNPGASHGPQKSQQLDGLIDR